MVSQVTNSAASVLWRRSTSRAQQAARVGLAAMVVGSLSWGLAPHASADTLSEQKQQVQAEIAKVQAALDDSSASLVNAVTAAATAQINVDKATAELATAKKNRLDAQKQDSIVAGAVTAADAASVVSKAAVSVGETNLATQKKVAGSVVRQNSQQNYQLLGVAAFLTNVNTGDVIERVQWSDTLFNTTQNQMDELQSAQLQVEDAKQSWQQSQTAVDEVKKAAAARVTQAKLLEQKAADAAAALQKTLATQLQAKADLESQIAAEKQRQAGLQQESAAVDARIKKQIEIDRAAAAAAKAAAQSGGSNSTTTTTTTSGGGSGNYTASSYFDWPVNAPITSPYGMRFHPVLHVWKLHDGTDLGASCGTAIRAPRDGVVSEEYFNAGYGNRLMINHGVINGHYVTTGYNHAENYVVSVGQHVSRGQVIGYVGTTGFSTGCHLHLMVWQDGTVVNPMSTWF